MVDIERLRELVCDGCHFVYVYKTEDALREQQCIRCERMKMFDELEKDLSFDSFFERWKDICDENRENCIMCPLLQHCDNPHFEIKMPENAKKVQFRKLEPIDKQAVMVSKDEMQIAASILRNLIESKVMVAEQREKIIDAVDILEEMIRI